MSSLRFCVDCNNLMYPKELRSERRLGFLCRSCGRSENGEEDEGNEGGLSVKQAANQNVVYRLALKRTAETKLELVDTQMVYDPTLPRTSNPNAKVCPECSSYQAVYFQASTGRDADMNLIFICCSCKHKWMQQ
ncbi:hypothetical protein BASA81_007859 [Batrachochytrium salamandrivorans]|nr:hypothetical protein BASA81_007859 [Batrachochytrium salamandrivorans]